MPAEDATPSSPQAPFTGPADTGLGGIPHPDAATAPPPDVIAREQAFEAEQLANVPREPGAPKPDSILIADGVVRRFGGVTAVNVDHVEFQRGAISALIGPNGAGKTTFFNLLTNFDKATAGSWTYNGQRMTGMAPHKVARLGMIRTFQLTKSLSKLTVIQNMMLGATNQKGERFLAAVVPPLWTAQEQAITERADALLERFRLAHMREEFAGSLSGGQRKLLEMARALMAEPELIMLDEPMAGVNPALKQSLLGHILSLRDEGRTVIFVEHDMDMVQEISDWVTVMAEGRLIAEGTPTDISSNDAVIDAYLGSHHDLDLRPDMVTNPDENGIEESL
ncbi:MAG: ABC transporter ATP-binding protein [Microthrixaceae bacterium]|nr:ABC transporter ATP-binding protein [Microthrixaceae bacterium]